MFKHRFNHSRIGVSFVALFVLLLSGLTAAEQTNAAWLKFAKAASLFEQQAPSSEIIPLLKEVQDATDDSVLFGRAAFLISDAYEREGQLEQAILQLQKPGESRIVLPGTMIAESWLRIGRLYLKGNKIQLAKSAFRRASEVSSNPFIQREALLGLAWIAAEQGEWTICDSLISELSSGEYVGARDERTIILKARQDIALERPEDAIQRLQNMNSQGGLYYLAKAHEMAENRIMAVSIYKKLRDLYSGTPAARQALFQAAEVFMRAGDWLAARSELRRLLDTGVGDPDAVHYRLGWVNMNLNRFEEALAEFRSPHAPENASYFKYMEAEVLRRQGAEDPAKLEQSILLFHNIASIDLRSPLAPLAKLKAALTEMEKGDSSNALISLRQFLKLYPKDELTPAVYFLLGANEAPVAGQQYFDRIIQQNQKSQFFDVSYFALQNHDFDRGDYQKVITRHASMPRHSGEEQLNYWQRANHLLMGESAYFLKHYQQAAAEYQLAKDVSQMDDLTEKAMIGEAWCKLHLNGADSALAAFNALRSRVKDSNKVLADYGYATVQFLKQNYMEALKAYPVNIRLDDAPELEALLVNSLFKRGQCFYRLQSYLEAIETWDKLAREHPRSVRAVEALFNIADIYFRANYFSEADSMYQLIIYNYPEDPLAVESSLKLAQSAYNATDYETAISRYQSFIEKYPQHEKNKEALEGIQLSYYQMGQMDQASEIFQKVVEQTSNTDLAIDARYRIATNYYQEENYQEAVEAFKEILTLYPNSSYAVDAQFALSKCYLSQGNNQAAVDEFLRFIQYFPNSSQSAEAHFLLGVAYYQMESYLSAIDYFEKVIENYPNSEYHSAALKNSAWCLDHLEDKQAALQRFSTYLEKYPAAEDAQSVRLQLGRLMLEAGNAKEGVAMLERLQKAEDVAVALEANYRLGMYYLSIDDIARAERVFRTAVNPNGGDNYYRLSALAQLAAIYENQDEQQKAISTYELLSNSTNEERWIDAARERINILRLAIQDKQ